jgi:hypothetical protein
MSNSEILLYQNQEGNIKIDVRLEEDTIWLTQDQMATLFGKAKSTINEHIKNVFEEGELDEKVVIRKFRITTKHGAITGKTQQVELNGYNLDVVISVGYRVKSSQGTQFRIWATQRLKEYIIKGFALKDDRFKSGSSMNFQKKIFKHLLFLFTLSILSISSYAQDSLAKTLAIITELKLVEAQYRQYNSMLSYLKMDAKGDDSIRILELEKKVTEDEITKRLMEAFDILFTEAEINDIYLFIQSSAFDKVMNLDQRDKLIYDQLNDIEMEIDSLMDSQSPNNSATKYIFEPIPVDRPDGFYETINYNPDEDKNKIQLSQNPAITIEDIKKVEKKKKSDYNNYPEIRITLTENGKQKFLLATQNNIEKPIAIVIDKHIVSMPIVKEPISGGELTLSGDFSDAEIDAMIERLGGKK